MYKKNIFKEKKIWIYFSKKLILCFRKLILDLKKLILDLKKLILDFIFFFISFKNHKKITQRIFSLSDKKSKQKFKNYYSAISVL